MRSLLTKYLGTALLLLSVILSLEGSAQVYCTGDTPFFSVDLSSDPGGTWISPAVQRDGSCCGGGADQVNCIELMVTLHPSASGINFEVFSGANPGGALYYQVNCSGAPISSGFSPIVCLDGPGPHYLSYCKVGNNTNEYAITSIPGPTTTPDIITNDGGCSQDMSIVGVNPATVTWSSISPGAPNQYNNFLTNSTQTATGTSGVPFTGYTDVVATPTVGAPPIIQYQVCGMADGSCSSEPFCDTISVEVVPTIGVTISPSSPYLCFGQAFETLTANVTGGLAPYTYLWSNGQTTQSINVTSGGNYSVTINDATGCAPAVANVTVIQFTEPITANAGPNLTVCEAISSDIAINGSVTGTTTGTWSGGTGTYSTDVNDLSLNYTLSPAEILAGSVTLTLTTTNTGTCPAAQDQVTISVSELTASLASQTNVSCFGGANGSAVISATGGIAPYSYSLNGGPAQASNSFNGLTAGNYTVSVTDGVGCPGTVNFTITEPTQLTFTSTATPVSCFGVCDGEIDVDAAGGTAPYTYSSNNGTTFGASDILTGLCAGTIGVVVRDNNNCLTNANVPITQPTQLTATYSLTDPICFGSCDGEITVNAAGATPIYQYSVNGGPLQAGATLTGLCAGNNNVLVEDANGCQITSVQVLVNPPTFGIDLVSMSESNCGFNNGTIEVAANGLNPPFTYTLNGGPSQPSGAWTNLVAGAYLFEATDVNGCIATAFYGINDIEMDGVNLELGNATCFGSCDGYVWDEGTNGAPPLTYELDNNGITQANGFFGGLCAGSHIVTIYDAGLCVFTLPHMITEPDEIQFTTAVTNVTCNGGSDGVIDFTSTIGGTGAYEYSIDGFTFQSSPTFTGLPMGTYWLYVMDENFCMVFGEVTITEPEPVDFTFSTTDLTCFGNNTGLIQIAATGGTGSYQFSINNGSTFQASNVFFGLAAGTYDVVVEDAVGCPATGVITLNEPAPLTAGYSSTPVSCFGTCDGSITVTANGGTTPYLYSVDNGITMVVPNTITGLCSGSYPVQTVDANGCGILSNVTISTPTQVNAFATPVTSTCSDPNGSITASANGGIPGYEYSIDNVTFGPGVNFNGLLAGSYTIYVHDINNCLATVTTIVGNQPAPVITGSSFGNVSCFGACDGTISITSTGGTGTVQYSLGGPYQLSNTFNGLCAGTYNLSITDDNGCVTNAAGPVDIIEPPLLQLTSTQINLSCFENGSGTINLTATGGTGTYQYSYDNGATFGTVAHANLLDAGTYDLIVQDENGCQATDQVTLTEPPLMEIINMLTTDALCFEYCDGTAEVTAQGGTIAGDYTYNWYTVALSPNASQINGLCAGTYNSVVLDDNGCWDTLSFVINEPNAQVIDSIQFTDPLCLGSCDGSITVFSPGAVQYSFDGGATYGPASTASAFCEGQYDIMVQNADGCLASDNSTVLTDPELLTVAAGMDTIICLGTDATIYANANGGVGTYIYHWDNAVDGQSQVVSPTTDTFYSVTVEDANGCTSAVSATQVSIYDDLVTQVSNATTVCPEDPVTLTVEVLSGQPGYTYNWTQLGSSATLGTSTVLNVNPDTTTRYVVTTEDFCRTVSDTIDVNVYYVPTVTFTAVQQEGCTPFTVQVIPTIDPSLIGSNCVWTVSDGSEYTTCNGFSATFADPGCYSVDFTGQSPDGCLMEGFGTDVFCVLANPFAYFTYNPDKPTYLNPDVQFNNLSTGGADMYLWNFQQYGSSTLEHPAISFTQSDVGDTILVCLHAETNEGCFDDVCLPVVIAEEYVVYVPNAFTPDGDKHNGIFIPVFAPNIALSEYELLIFNRWGELIFKTDNPQEGWNGYYHDKLMQSGVYTWKIRLKEGEKKNKHDYVGHVTLLK